MMLQLDRDIEYIRVWTSNCHVCIFADLHEERPVFTGRWVVIVQLIPSVTLETKQTHVNMLSCVFNEHCLGNITIKTMQIKFEVFTRLVASVS